MRSLHRSAGGGFFMVTTPGSLRLAPPREDSRSFSQVMPPRVLESLTRLRRSACCVGSLDFDWMFSHGFLYPRNKNSGVIKGVGSPLMVTNR